MSVHVYDRWAPTYDRVWRRYTDATLDYLLDVLDLTSVGDVLDVGCGTGALLERLRHRLPQARLAGIDTSAEMLRIARQRLVGAEVRLAVGPAERVLCANESLDLVTMASMLHYVPRLSLALGEARRVLRPGGTVAIIDYLPRGLHGSVADGLLRLYDRGHVRSLRLPDIEVALRAVGFDVTYSAMFPISRIFRGVCVLGVKADTRAGIVRHV